MAPDTSAAVVVQGLVKSYGGRRVVDSLDLAARRGAVTAVLGPNGAGKTTTVECCEGLRRPDSGIVRVLGADPALAGPEHRARVGVMLQGGGLPAAAHALELVRHVARLHAAPLDPDALAERLGVSTFARTVVRRLSGGQRQRVALACALVGRPEVLFLDEPSAGLDPQARLGVWDLVQQARREGAAIVLTTHLIEEAERLADLVVVVDSGRVVAHGSPSELTGVRDEAESLRFGADPRLDLTTLRTALPDDVRIDEPVPGQYVVTGTVDPGVIATVTSWCAAQHVMPEGLTVGRRSLEDVFLDLTGRSLR
ncbi:MAG TPA: ABC transporter ATP-binding protein [Actinomycetales bacterium]|nr:ABC transporter ATP-binding protein [Actinomycetales bacterium]